MQIEKLLQNTCDKLRTLEFTGVYAVYNPLEYALKPYLKYWRMYANAPKEAVFLGMNPGPFGMAQTGIPFGEVTIARDWLKVEDQVGRPAAEHPKRPITGYAVERSEVSGRRLWGLMQKTFVTPQAFFGRFFVANYCPLMFFGPGGQNITPDKLAKDERAALTLILDECLVGTMDLLKPRYVVGIGKYAADSASRGLVGTGIEVGRTTHPSPANPKANKGWENIFVSELSTAGIKLVN